MMIDWLFGRHDDTNTSPCDNATTDDYDDEEDFDVCNKSPLAITLKELLDDEYDRDERYAIINKELQKEICRYKIEDPVHCLLEVFVLPFCCIFVDDTMDSMGTRSCRRMTQRKIELLEVQYQIAIHRKYHAEKIEKKLSLATVQEQAFRNTQLYMTLRDCGDLSTIHNIVQHAVELENKRRMVDQLADEFLRRCHKTKTDAETEQERLYKSLEDTGKAANVGFLRDVPREVMIPHSGFVLSKKMYRI